MNLFKLKAVGRIYVSLALLGSLMSALDHLQAVEVHRRGLAVHGPFGVNSADLDSASTGGSSVPDDLDFRDLAGQFTVLVGGEPTVEPSGPQTPTAAISFEASASLRGIDPGIAVGNSYILVSDNANGVAGYDKTGKVLGPKSSGSAFPNPFTVASLFSKVKADIDPLLNYPSGLPPGFTVAEGKGITAYGDVRVMFDAYRKRFWIYARAKNEPPTGSKDMVDYPALKLARRQKAAVAVSKTEDPRDGFYTYWWNETIRNGSCNDPNGCSDSVFKVSGEGADYPSIGLSPKYFLATVGVNRRDPNFEIRTEDQAVAWKACKTSFVADGQTFNWCGPFYNHMMVVDADILAKGCPGRRQQLGGLQVLPCRAGRSFALFVDARNYITDRHEDGDFAPKNSLSIRPVVMHGPVVRTRSVPALDLSREDAYFVNTFIDRSEKEPHYRLVLWSLVGDDLIPTISRIRPFRDSSDKFDNHVLNASYRNGNLYATFHECWAGFEDGCLRAVRVVRVNTLNSETEIDRTFGVNHKFDDNPTDRFHYKYPGIEVTKYGDIVVVYTRFSFDKAQQRQEVRFSVWYNNASDIRPSRLLHAAEADFAEEFVDTAGIAVDPSNDKTIWMAHIFAAKDTAGQPHLRIAVGAVKPRVTLGPRRRLNSRQ